MEQAHFGSEHTGDDPQGQCSVTNEKQNRSVELSFTRTESALAVSGWIATILGIYLFASGFYNLYRLSTKSATEAELQGSIPELIGTSSLGMTDNLSIIILVSYVAGLPIFAGSTLMAIGSLARSAKRLCTSRDVKVKLNSDKWIVGGPTREQRYENMVSHLARFNISSSRLSFNKSFIGDDIAKIRDKDFKIVAIYKKEMRTGFWRLCSVRR
jgi:hypothetical protein